MSMVRPIKGKLTVVSFDPNKSFSNHRVNCVSLAYFLRKYSPLIFGLIVVRSRKVLSKREDVPWHFYSLQEHIVIMIHCFRVKANHTLMDGD